MYIIYHKKLLATLAEDKVWRWSDGSESKYESWHEGEPNFGEPPEFCAYLGHYEVFGDWDDEPCSVTHELICKIKKGEKFDGT